MRRFQPGQGEGKLLPSWEVGLPLRRRTGTRQRTAPLPSLEDHCTPSPFPNLLPLFSSHPPFSHSPLTRKPGCSATGQWSSTQPGGGGGRGHCDRKRRVQVGHFGGKISSPLNWERTKPASYLFCVGWGRPTMSQSPGAGSAATAATAVRSSPCRELSVRGKGPRGGRVPLEGAQRRRVGQAQPVKLRQSPDQSLPFWQGWGGWGAAARWVCVNESLCVYALIYDSGREADFGVHIGCPGLERWRDWRALADPQRDQSHQPTTSSSALGSRIRFYRGGSPSFVHRKTCGDWLPHRRFHVGVEVARRGGQRSAELVRVAAGRRCAARGWLSHKHACQGCLTHALRSFWLERKIKEPDWEHISSSILFHFLIWQWDNSERAGSRNRLGNIPNKLVS